jgi:hypothetical protein
VSPLKKADEVRIVRNGYECGSVPILLRSFAEPFLRIQDLYPPLSSHEKMGAHSTK